MRRARQRSILLGALVLALCASGQLDARDTALGPNGVLYRVSVGTYGGLFPGGTETAAHNPVLALDVLRPGQPSERWLVPSTQGTAVPSEPYLLAEAESDRVHLVWESTHNLVHSSVWLVTFERQGFSQPIEVSWNPYTLKSSPRIAVTQDTFTLEGPDGFEWTVERQVLHTLWWADATDAGSQISYAPLTLLGGAYIGTNWVYSLRDFGDRPAAALPPGVAAELFLAPAIRAGEGEATVVAAYANAETARLMTLEVGVIPDALIRMAESVRRYVAGSPLECARESERLILAQLTYNYILTFQDRFHVAALEHIANTTRDLILRGGEGACGGGLVALADEARIHIIGTGSKARRGFLLNAADLARIHIIGTGFQSLSQTEEEEEHLLEVREILNLPLPATGEAPTTVLLSADAEQVLVAWEEASRLCYRESRDGGWSGVNEIAIGNGMSREEAYLVLQARIDGR